MLTFKQNFSIGIGVTNNNLLAGDLLQFLPWDAMINIWASQSAAGLEYRITIGVIVVGGSGQPMRPNIRATGDIITDEDQLASGVGERGDQVIVTVSNPTAGILTTTCQVVAEPIPL